MSINKNNKYGNKPGFLDSFVYHHRPSIKRLLLQLQLFPHQIKDVYHLFKWTEIEGAQLQDASWTSGMLTQILRK